MIKASSCCWLGDRRCKWYKGFIQEAVEKGEKHSCLAFPKGIPREIAFGTIHNKVVEGQEGKYIYRKETDIKNHWANLKNVGKKK